jgi:CRP-like cAMP-binding protein
MAYLIHVANVLYLLSYLVKDILWLRLLSIVGGSLLMVTYLASVPPLLVPLAWGAVFAAINAYQIYLLILERRPVRLKEDEQHLYQLVFRSLTPREFVKLLALARWETARADERLVERGRQLDRMMVIVSGAAAVQLDGTALTQLGAGKFIGEMSYITGEHPSADVVATEDTRLVSWPKDELKRFLAHNQPLRAAMQLVIGTDLVAKLRAA